MDQTELFVVIAAVAVIGATLWFFFGPRPRVSAHVSEGGVQQVAITVKGGYSPDRIVVRKGIPVRLDFHREETSSCTDQVILGDFGISRALPAFRTTSIEFTPQKTGEFTFSCGMNMVHGRLIVEEA